MFRSAIWILTGAKIDSFRSAIWFRSAILIPNPNPIPNPTPNPSQSEPIIILKLTRRLRYNSAEIFFFSFR